MARVNKNVKPLSIQILLWAIVTFVAIDGLAKFNVFDLTQYISPVLIPTVASLFILSEIGIMQMVGGRRKKKLDALQWFGLTVALVSLLGVVLSFTGVTIESLNAIQGVVSFSLGLYAVVEIFKK